MTVAPLAQSSYLNEGRRLRGMVGRTHKTLAAGAFAFGLVLAQPIGHTQAHPRIDPRDTSATAAATTSSAESMDILEDLFFWEDYPGVRRLLLQHPETHGPLVHAAGLIPEYFGSSSRLSLRVDWGPEGSDSPRLLANIYTTQAPADALDSLERFDVDWWLDAMQNLHHVLSFGLRFE